MILSELLHKIPVLETSGILALSEVEVSEIVFDSRKVTEGSLYVAIKGTVSDGHSYISSAIEKGAKTIVCEVLPENLIDGINYIQVKNSSKILANFVLIFIEILSKNLN